ncbi:MAG TPA: hypothetical protein VFF13_01905 [archaeon]|nr:hypothetical protein [archaeon]
MASLNELLGVDSSEELRLKLLKEELKLRKKQPEAWTKTKYRPYANFRTKKKEDVPIATVQAKA